MRSPLASATLTNSEVVIRCLHRADRGRLDAFYTNLSPESRRKRFFTEQLPPNAARSACEAIGTQPATPQLVAHDRGDPDVIVAEAITAYRGPGTAEFALAVGDEHQHRGLGAVILSALADRAAATGIHTLVAEVLLDNRAMLSLLRARHAVAVSPQQLPILTLAIATSEAVAYWPPSQGRRILIEGAGWLALSEQSAQQLADEGCSVLVCPPDGSGSAPRQDCPLLNGRTCPLRAEADTVINRFPGEPFAGREPRRPAP